MTYDTLGIYFTKTEKKNNFEDYLCGQNFSKVKWWGKVKIKYISFLGHNEEILTYHQWDTVDRPINYLAYHPKIISLAGLLKL